MGLASDIGYVYKRPNRAQRTVQSLASTKAGAWLFSSLLAPMDRTVSRVTHDRVSMPWLLAGLPALVLTTTGRKTGQPRQAHLIAVPFRGTLALLGTNFGQTATPAWVLNLEADPRGTVTHKGRTRDIHARPATPAEQAEVLATSTSVYGGYVKYQQRISRKLRIFILEEAVTSS